MTTTYEIMTNTLIDNFLIGKKIKCTKIYYDKIVFILKDNIKCTIDNTKGETIKHNFISDKTSIGNSCASTYDKKGRIIQYDFSNGMKLYIKYNWLGLVKIFKTTQKK